VRAYPPGHMARRNINGRAWFNLMTGFEGYIGINSIMKEFTDISY
jgi:hypothetical protein